MNNERILITLEISDPETVREYKDVSDELLFDDLVNGELIRYVSLVFRKNQNLK